MSEPLQEPSDAQQDSRQTFGQDSPPVSSRYGIQQRSMRGAVHEQYGPPESIEIRQLDIPTVEPDQVLLKVEAASINPLDWHLMTGTPYLVRLQAGLTKPKRTIPGADVAGVVQTVGHRVTGLKPGDEVFGWAAGGGCAEYLALSEEQLVAKPANLSFAEAAAVPVAALTALQALRNKAGVRAGHRVLINGASGGVGTFAVQIARALGAEVTGVCSPGNVETAKRLGADPVIDYTVDDFANKVGGYDIVLDMPGNRPLSDFRRIMAPRGRYVLIGGSKNPWFGPFPRLIKMMMYSPLVGRKFSALLSKENQADLQLLAGLLDDKSISPVLDRTYDLDQIGEALRYQAEGHAKGKIVITP